MTQRVRNLRPLFNDRPFEGTGTSAYATQGDEVRYRNLRVLGTRRKWSRRSRGQAAHWIKGAGGTHDVANAVTKTARRASEADPTASIDVDLSAAGLVPPSGTQQVTIDVRTYDSDAENLTTNFRPVTVTVDSGGASSDAILGTATLLDVEIRAGGVVRIRFVWNASSDGTQPTQFRLTRTAGPTSPSDVTQSYAGERLVEIDTPALNDSAAYTYKITAENGATTKDVIEDLQFTADATGPPAPVNGEAFAW